MKAYPIFKVNQFEFVLYDDSIKIKNVKTGYWQKVELIV